MVNIELKTNRDIKNMINALHREKRTLQDHIVHYEKQPQTIYMRKLIASHKLDIKIIEEWEEKLQKGVRNS